MKTLALLLLIAAAGNSARAQQATYVQGCKPYSFPGNPAAGAGAITYQWYRNGQPIPGATDKDCLLPAQEAYGENVEFKRGAMSSSCPGEVAFSNVFHLTFSGVRTDTVCWAHSNVDDPYTFASKPDMYTKFYQWNRTTAWPATGSISGWNSSSQSAPFTQDPCPAGWRVPKYDEVSALINSGVALAAARTRGNEVAGAFFGPNHATCTLPSNMANCVFLPAVGSREGGSGTLEDQGSYGFYWSSTTSYMSYSFAIYFSLPDDNAESSMSNNRANGYTIRCVQ